MTHIYLATPYSHWFPPIRWWRYIAVTRMAAKIMEAGHTVFSPITHSHPMSLFMPPKSLKFWLSQDKPHMDAADELWIAKVRGWGGSVGVWQEIAGMSGKPMYLVDAKTLDKVPLGNPR